MDTMLLKIVGENWLTIYLIITLLKGIALLTPSVQDDKIITLLSQAYTQLRGKAAPDRIE
jgi:hypothetical protein